MAKEKFPDVIYVRWDGEGDPYLAASEELFSLIEDDGSQTQYAVYKREGIGTARMVIEILKPPGEKKS